MKRVFLSVIAVFAMAVAFAGTPGSITMDGDGPNGASLVQFLNNPTFPNITVTNPISAVGGVATAGTLAQLRITNIPIGPVALASVGTNTADVNGQIWISSLFVPANKTITKIGFLQGGTATTDNTIVAIYDPAGKFLTSSALTGVVLSGANTFQEQTLLSSVTLVGPATYFIAVQGNGTTAGAIQTVSALYNQIYTTHIAGTFGTLPASITLPTTFTTADAPVVYAF